VAKVTRPGSYHLQTLEGEDINNSWNVNQLCRFYAYSTRLLRGSSLHDYFNTPPPSAASGSWLQSPDYSSLGSSPRGYLRILGCDK
jgi:hypothetical protein